jgi:trehalose/maltose hydrolase-like predicted phosphorylase
MVAWAFDKAFRIVEGFSPDERQAVMDTIGLTNSEIIRWKKIAGNLALGISPEGIIEQFSGYFALKELDWDHYRQQYDDIHRMDRILKAENKSPDDYKVSKQADLLMTFYNLNEREVTAIIEALGYTVPEDYLKRNLDYYLTRTSHGSTLSRLVHAHLAYKAGNRSMGWTLYLEALLSDLVDIQGGTTGEGIHCGVMTGTVYTVLKTFCGLDLSEEIPGLCPDLPAHWTGLHFRFRFRATLYQVSLFRDKIEISARRDGDENIIFHICGEKYELQNNQKLVVRINM